MEGLCYWIFLNMSFILCLVSSEYFIALSKEFLLFELSIGENTLGRENVQNPADDLVPSSGLNHHLGELLEKGTGHGRDRRRTRPCSSSDRTWAGCRGRLR